MSEQIRVHVRLFAMLRERAGESALELSVPRGATVADALEALSHTPGLGQLLGRLPLRVAVNRDYAELRTTLHAGDELALIPPVSGGAQAASHVRVGTGPISLERVSGAVADDAAGAIVVFQGVTRELPLLEYEAYGEMAAAQIERILRDCVGAHGLLRAAAEHRVGEVPLGECSVAVAASAPHREEAFAGARAAIDRIKAEAPIWKREHHADGRRRWV